MKWIVKFCYKDDCITYVAEYPDVGERLLDINIEGVFG